MRSQRRTLLILLGVLLVVAGIGINVMLPRLLPAPGPTGTSGPPPVTVKTAPIVVSAVAISEGTKLDSSNLTVVQYPIDQLPPGAYTKVTDLTTVTYFAAIALPARLPITKELLVTCAECPNPLTHAPLEIPPGDVAFPIAYDNLSMGYFLPGSRVDLLVAKTDSPAFYALQNVLVGQIGNPGEGSASGAAAKPTVIILFVSHADALTIGDIVGGFQGAHIIRILLRSKP